ncbi:MAG: T9SS type A sorting domain-containing protein [Dysgonamonadaceae bacterium]|nr:T9SS type A sorting domain-containing protein [Dysgonamonadaceae bacterium]
MMFGHTTIKLTLILITAVQTDNFSYLADNTGCLHILNLEENAKVQIYDITGKQIIETATIVEEIKLPQRGVYIVKVQSGNQISSGKVVW